MQRTATGKGYWMMTKDGRIFRFGDAQGLRRHRGAARTTAARGALLVTPSGHGYWVATGNGSIIAVRRRRAASASRRRVGGPTIALIASN